MSQQEHTIEVPEDAGGQRIDRFLAGALGESRNRVQRRIADEGIRVEGQSVNASFRVSGGERIVVTEPPEPAVDETLEPEPLGENLGIVAEAEDYVVLSKPPGLIVHPGAGHDQGTLAHQLLSRYPEISRVGHPQRPGIVHRLDVGTSGVMVVARTGRGYLALSRAFSTRRVRKRYLAIVYGDRVEEMEIDLPIGRHPKDRKRMAVRSNGRPALSRVRALASGSGLSLVEVELHTGRTHQIRVHLKAAKHPLIGDPTYGEARWKAFPTRDQPALRDFGRPALHAWKLAFPDPALEAPMDQETEGLRFKDYAVEAPEDMRALWSRRVGDWAI